MITQEQIETIQRVVNRVYKKYVFGYFSDEDIKQQATLIAIEAIEKYWDKERPLENFLAVHIPNRLKNFKRDNYFRLDISEENSKRYNSNNTKKKLMETSELFEIDLLAEESPAEKLSNKEALDNLKKKMPQEILSDYLRLANNVVIPKVRKEAVFKFVMENIDENW